MTKKTGLYIHIPFCVQKCKYCAFLSFDAIRSPRKEYTDALVEEIKLRGRLLAEQNGGDKPELDTVYVGGGTPTVLDISQMRDIMHAVKTSFVIKDDAEITIEANPATLGRKDGVMKAKLVAYKYMGFNRISMGVQAMDNARLDLLGRIHTKENVERDVSLIREAGFDNLNLDLIFSIPGETTDDALTDLRAILDFEPEHISCYSLQIEENTPFAKMLARGEIEEASEEDDRATCHAICDELKKAGYEHYEISNFAKIRDGKVQDDEFRDALSVKADDIDNPCSLSPFRSRHNSLYWDMSDYVAVGLGASGFICGTRYKNISDIEKYIEIFGRTDDERSRGTGNERLVAVGDLSDLPADEYHVNSAFDNISEAVFTGLRRREGISYEEALYAYDAIGAAADAAERSEYASEFDRFWSIFRDALEEAEDFATKGYLIIGEAGLRLTEKGVDISNSIMALFV